jgi:16S rRNA (guanine966-N2)-methyltransferase
MIRITGGEVKGRSLKVYRGGQVRPTSDKVRQAIYNILEHGFEFEFETSRCLDLYAGSGGLGAELLSRGGSHLTAVESDARTLSVLRDNLKMVKQAVRSRTVDINVVSQTVERYLKRPPASPYDLIIADPPYKEQLGPKLLACLSMGWISSDGVVVIEHEKRDPFTPPYGWSLDDRRLYGDTFVSFCSIMNVEKTTS